MKLKYILISLISLHFAGSRKWRDDRNYKLAKRDNGNIERILSEKMKPKPGKKRVQTDFLGHFEGKDLKSTLPDSLISSGQTGDLTCSTQNVIQSKNFPSAASRSSTSDYHFDLQPGIEVAIYFYDFNVQCRFGSVIKVYYDNELQRSICENGLLTQVYVPLPEHQNVKKLRLEHVTSNSRSRQKRGYFQAVVIGFGPVCKKRTRYSFTSGRPSPSRNPSSPRPSPSSTAHSASSPFNCGISDPQNRILNGRQAKIGEYPWQVYAALGGVACGGTVISNRWVMTAAHCASSVANSPQLITMYLGCHDLLGSKQPEICQALSFVSEVIIHSGYPGVFADNDIALLGTTAPLSFSNRIRPVCIPTNPVPNGKRLKAVGWGKTNANNPYVLRKASTTSISDWQCRANLPTVLCTRSHRGFGDGNICFGDSGGFLGDTSGPDGRWVQHGISSYVFGNCLVNYPQGFTEVSKYSGWIQDHAGVDPVQNSY